MHFESSQWLIGFLAAMLMGISKTGVPGMGMLSVSMLAYAFGGWASVGVVLPMLLFADCFAVLWYHRHAHWDKLFGLAPWVVTGMGFGGMALWVIGGSNGQKSFLNVVIGAMVLIMLAVYLLQNRTGNRLSPKSKVGIASIGAAAGFATTVANAAGPIMQVYMSAHDLRKEQFMGTLAWYYFIFNVAKLPIFIALSWLHPKSPIITGHSLLLDLLLAPAVLVGVFVGKWILPRISQKMFNTAVITLASLAASKLIVDYVVKMLMH